jgi:hypothetical protein
MVSEQMRRTSSDARTKPYPALGEKNFGSRFFNFKGAVQSLAKKYALKK